MNRKISVFVVLLLLIMTVSVSACGQRGPLYLPEKGEEVPAEKESEKESEEKTTF